MLNNPLQIGSVIKHESGETGVIIDVYHPRISSDNSKWWLVEFECGDIEGIPEYWMRLNDSGQDEAFDNAE